MTPAETPPPKPYELVSLEHSHVPLVRALNQRLRAGGEASAFPASPDAAWLPKLPGRTVFVERYVALQEGCARGGYMVRWQKFQLGGEIRTVANMQLPVSEGAVAREHASLAALFIRDALRREPLLYVLGLGGHESRFAKLLAAMRFVMIDCPFFFYVMRPYRFLRGVAFLRTRSRWLRFAMDAAALTGAGSVSLPLAHAALRTLGGRVERGTAVRVDRFGPWTDEIWDAARAHYALLGERTAATLELIYPEADPRFHRLRVEGPRGRTVGWALVMCNRLRSHRHFGDLVLGSLVDGLALPGAERFVVEEATRYLCRSGADLAVTNQLHEAWCRAVRASGWFPGPSNYVFAASPALAKRLAPFSGQVFRCQMTRGDGDGPIHLG